MQEFKLPELGEGVHEGELVRWAVQVGDQVQFDQILCEIMTDKATIEIPSSLVGKVKTLNAKPADMVRVGQTLIHFEGSAEVQKEEKPASTPKPFVEMKTEQSHSVLAAPIVRKKAYEQNIDLNQIKGSGEKGRILLDDLQAQPVLMSPSSDQRIPLMGLRKKIAQKMRHSVDHAAHFTYVEEANASALVALRNALKSSAAEKGVKLTYLPFIFKAMVAALKDYPVLNANFDDESNTLIVKNQYHFGLSVQTDDGLMAPVIKNVDQMSLLQIAKEIDRLATLARNKKLSAAELSGGTMTVTNIGSIGGLFATPIINYPEVAILGLNKITKKPIVKENNEIGIADWTYFSLSLDHRVIDGATAAFFMKRFIQIIETPQLLLL
jgi:pyruvate dehydrogenase E2 component (dihydrolipoamide acetyltransferase)